MLGSQFLQLTLQDPSFKVCFWRNQNFLPGDEFDLLNIKFHHANSIRAKPENQICSFIYIKLLFFYFSPFKEENCSFQTVLAVETIHLELLST